MVEQSEQAEGAAPAAGAAAAAAESAQPRPRRRHRRVRTAPPPGSDPAPQSGAAAELSDEDRPEAWGDLPAQDAKAAADAALLRDLPPHWGRV